MEGATVFLFSGSVDKDHRKVQGSSAARTLSLSALAVPCSREQAAKLFSIPK